MSLKCRCGSDDRLSFDGNQIIRIADKKSHVCLDEDTSSKEEKQEDRDEYLKNKQKEIMLGTKEESMVASYIKRENNILNEIENVLIKQDYSLKDNVQKLGMKMKIIYLGMSDSDKYGSCQE